MTMLTQLESTNVINYGLPDGYTLRPATLDDLPEAVEMFNAYSRRLIGVDDIVLENYRVEWMVPALKIEDDIRVVLSSEGKIVGCMEVWDLFDPHTRINVWGRVHPDHQGRGIASAMLRWAEDRARQAIVRAPQEARVAMLSWVNNLDTAAHSAFMRAGFNLIRHSYRMRIDMNGAPPIPAWPHGITVRTFVPGQDDRATVECDRDSFRDHWGFVERLFEDDLKMFQHFMYGPDSDPSLCFLAMDGDRIAGIALCRPKIDDEPDMGWVDDLGVRREYRRKGLGLALLHHAFAEFYRRGTRKAGLGVDAYNLTGALRLYERAGMRAYRQFNTFEKELRAGVELSTQTAG
jgi:mycothiol synthase